jgi:hypothetical protein
MTHKLTYLAEIIFPTDKPDKEFIEEIEKLAAARNIKVLVTGDYYQGNTAKNEQEKFLVNELEKMGAQFVDCTPGNKTVLKLGKTMTVVPIDKTKPCETCEASVNEEDWNKHGGIILCKTCGESLKQNGYVMVEK